MQKKEPLPELPGYLTIKQAAKILGLSTRRIYQLIEAGRLPAVKAGQTIMLSMEAVERFKPRLTGRPRERNRPWRSPRRGATLRTLSIQVQVRDGQQDRLQIKLWKIRQEGRHTLPGTMTRLIMKEDPTPVTVTIILVWEHEGSEEEEILRLALKDFEEELADILDWETATRRTGRLIIGT